MKDSNKNLSFLIGFSQVFFDCPQPLCIDGGIDDITNDENGNLLIFRGKYFWNLTQNSPTVEISKSKLISNSFKNIPSHLDAVTTNIDEQITYFFKV